MRHIYHRVRSSDIIQLLSYPPYLYFALSVICSQLAYYMLNVILIFVIFSFFHSNFSVSILLLTLILPQILLSFFGGILADSKDKKSILFYGNLLRGLVLLLLYFNNHSGVLLYIVSLIVSIATQFYVPAEAPMIPNLVKDKRHLIVANSIFGMGLFGTILAGYVLAGPAISTLGQSNVFLVVSGIFFIAAFFAGIIPRSVTDRDQTKKMESVKRAIHGELRESYRLLRKTSDIGGAFFLLAFSQVIILVLASIVPGYAEKILNIPTEQLSLVLFAPAAVGMIIAAIFINTIGKNISHNKLMNAGMFLSGIALSLFPLTSKAAVGSTLRSLNIILPPIFQLSIVDLAIILAAIAGFANACIFIPSQTIIQNMTPQDFQSKIYGLLFALIGVFSLLPILIAGSVADVVGVGSVLTGVGIFILILAVLKVRPRLPRVK